MILTASWPGPSVDYAWGSGVFCLLMQRFCFVILEILLGVGPSFILLTSSALPITMHRNLTLPSKAIFSCTQTCNLMITPFVSTIRASVNKKHHMSFTGTGRDCT